MGDDARLLASEVEKLAAYAGERKVITAEDVDEVVTRSAADPFFALGNAVEARDLAGALGVLDRTLADGGSPFMVLGGLASTLRRLVVERERARRVVGERRLGSAQEWERWVLPHVTPEELEGKKPFGFWKKLEAAQRFERAALLEALAGLAAADRSMKAGADGRPLLERVLWRLLAPAAGRKETVSERILVTSALPYANGSIHLGHLVEYIQTDVYVRFRRACGDEVAYVCAADSHGTPIEVNAAKAGLSPKAFVEHYRTEQHADFRAFGVEFSTYYTTDSEENRRWAYRVYDALKEKGLIYKRSVEQLYCEHDGRFLPDRLREGHLPQLRAPPTSTATSASGAAPPTTRAT